MQPKSVFYVRKVLRNMGLITVQVCYTVKLEHCPHCLSNISLFMSVLLNISLYICLFCLISLFISVCFNQYLSLYLSVLLNISLYVLSVLDISLSSHFVNNFLFIVFLSMLNEVANKNAGLWGVIFFSAASLHSVSAGC